MDKIYIEVVNERDGIEYCEDNNYTFAGFDYKNSEIYLTAYTNAESKQDKNGFSIVGSDDIEVKHEYGYIVYTVSEGRMLYVSRRSIRGRYITFNIAEAKIFNKDEAKLKAYCMTTSSKRNYWRVRKI